MNVEFVEVFAGVAEISKACRAHGLVGSSHDITYSAHYDLCGRTGFLYHGLIRFLCISIFGISIIRSICPVSYLGFRPKLECLTLGPGIGVDR